MSLDKLILEAYNDVYCKIAPSDIHGVGVFAVKDIPKNVVIFRSVYDFVKINKKFLSRISPNVAKLYKRFFISDEDNIWIPKSGLNNINISFYLNHSENPNVIWSHEYKLFISKVPILENTELTVNYKSFGGTIDF